MGVYLLTTYVNKYTDYKTNHNLNIADTTDWLKIKRKKNTQEYERPCPPSRSSMPTVLSSFLLRSNLRLTCIRGVLPTDTVSHITPHLSSSTTNLPIYLYIFRTRIKYIDTIKTTALDGNYSVQPHVYI